MTGLVCSNFGVIVGPDYYTVPFPCGKSEPIALLCWNKGFDHDKMPGDNFPYSNPKFKAGYEACERVWADYSRRVLLENEEAVARRERREKEEREEEMRLIREWRPK